MLLSKVKNSFNLSLDNPLHILTSSSAIAERRTALRVGQFWPKVEDDILQAIYLQPLACKAIEFGEKKTQNKGYYAVQVSRSFKVTHVSTNRMTACDFLLNDSN